MDFKRADRVADLVKAEISDIVLRTIKDPRVQRVTVTDVKMSDDLRLAKIFFVPMEGSVLDDVQSGLQKASGFLRRELSKRLQLRYAPQLMFVFDASFDYGDRIETLLSGIRQGEAEDGEHDS